MAEVVTSGLAGQLFWIVQLKGIGKGVEEDVEKLSNNLAAVRAMLFDADQRQFADESVRLWVDKVQDYCYEADAVLDEWRTAILKSRIAKEEGEVDLPTKKVCFCIPSSSFCLTHFHRVVLRRDIALKIMELNKKVVEITTDREKYTFEKRSTENERVMTTFSTSVLDESVICGRDEEKNFLLSKLLSQQSKDNRGLEIIPVVGMGGIGKTTLAQLAFNDDQIRNNFELKIWVHVGESFDLIRIAKAIIETITDSNKSELFELESLLTCINRSIRGRRVLLVLDEVWTEDWTKWEPLEGSLKDGAYGSKILVTTRNKKVAVMMRATTQMVCLERLSDEACWHIFGELAFLGGDQKEREQLEEIGKKIVKKCDGVPLVVKTLGHLMHDKYSKEEWKKVSRDQLWELSDVEQTVFPSLLLSYYDLSPFEKRCALYCSLFPVDFEFDRDDLIELWMSQGYLEYGNKSFEKGENLFKSLVMRSIFQNFGESFQYGKFIRCRMNDVMHETVQFVARNKCFMWEGFSSDERTNQENEIIHHFSLLLRSGAQIPISVYRKKNLRTLFVMRSEASSPLNLNLLPKLTSLWTLCLHGCDVEKLPGRIDKLIHLRYLNLSDNRNLKELPYELCNLLNLQTLRLNGCTELQSLPKRMGKLVNLRHLYIAGCDRLEELPKGIGRLTSLRILDVFIVPCDYRKNNKAMKLKDLSKLKQFQGNLCIRGIGNVDNAGDAAKAELWNNNNLVDLELDFGQSTGPRRTEDELAVLLEVLEPPPDLKCLAIKEYHGAKFSNWMVSLVHLRRLELFRCPNCEFLPPFGELPSLEFLNMCSLDKVTKVGLEFLGVESDTTEVSFPRLRELRFSGLHSWKQWLETGDSISSCTIMPLLFSLEISDCENLETLPDFLSRIPLEELRIDNCPILENRCQEWAGEDWFKIQHIPYIRIAGISLANDERVKKHRAE